MTVQYLEIAGQRMAVLPAADFARLVEAADDRADSAAAERAEQRRAAGEAYLPIDRVDQLLAGASPLKVWRQHRGMTQKALAAAVGCRATKIPELERGKGTGSASLWGKLAAALGVSVEDVAPQ